MADKILLVEEITEIIYYSAMHLGRLLAPDTELVTFDKLSGPERAIIDSQVAKMIENVRLDPHELHDNWKVTTQSLIAKGIVEDKLIAKLEPYMIPFRELPVWKKTEYRLHLQLVRTLLRHNKNVERAQKRQR